MSDGAKGFVEAEYVRLKSTTSDRRLNVRLRPLCGRTTSEKPEPLPTWIFVLLIHPETYTS